MSTLRLEELSAATIVAVNKLGLKPGQEQFVTPVSYAAAAAVTPAHTAWQRVVLENDRVVGFIHGNFDPDAPQEEFRAALWRINVDADAQGMGVGTFAVNALIEEARARGVDRLTVLWERGEDGPEEFFLHIGFVPIGETPYGEVIGAIQL
ncbi:GNAT family N-acetyltransferase [Leucobacter insecticola]|uniref:GNAT family N-acetyltransferase n=1 Tax=Leucobacter insecticola TaxID=2714934 RepID=A0A6G8FHJ8_9MICO|nr:GNAT family N-acetyltransferase [Leucobacter insecticola]QIM15834.1 GNAT family N-acetyltransferase [Leucobacter insecticola]